MMLGAVFLAGLAHAGDVSIPWQGRVLDASGDAYEGSIPLTLTLEDDSGTVHWRKNFGTVPFSSGYASVTLAGLDDSNRDLMSSLFVNHDLFVVITVDGNTLSPSQAIASVPRAASVVGGVQVGDNTATCDDAGGGTLRWTGDELQVCNGARWVTITDDALDGSEPSAASSSCKQLHADYPLLPSGSYWIDPNGGTTLDAFEAYCEMEFREGGWTLCLSNVERGRGTTIADQNLWWIDTWDKGSRVFTRGNKQQGSSWGNFCPDMVPDADEVYATIYNQSNSLAVGDTCALADTWFTPGSGHTPLACEGSTIMTAIPKNNLDAQSCTGCIYWQNESTPNTSPANWSHNNFGTHVMVRLQGQSAYAAGGIHWGYVNTGMSDPSNAGDIHCGENGSWCYEAYFAGTPVAWHKSMQLYVR